MDGESGEDIVIGGRLSYDTNLASLLTLQAAWTDTTRAYAARVSRIISGAPGVGINASSVVDDTAADSIRGGTDTDWFIKQSLDVLVDRQGFETLSNL